MAESSSQDRFAAPGAPGASYAAFPRWAAARQAGSPDLDPGPLLLPGPDESPAAYLARLTALHQRLGALIATIEQRRDAQARTLARPPLAATAAPPAPVAPPRPIAVPPPAAPRLRPPLEPPPVQERVWPAQERRLGVERRIGAADRRHGVGDRRRGAADMRAEPIERRSGPRDRRTGPDDRRHGMERRRVVRSLPWEGGLRLDATTMVWVVQVLAWTAIAVVALVYGLGHN